MKILYVFAFCFKPLMLLANLNVTVVAESAILMNADNGSILFQKNINVPQYPASITKIATAAYALQVAESLLHQSFTASKTALTVVKADAKKHANYTTPAYWLEPEGSHMGLKVGESMCLRHLLYGLLLASGNDAANVIAESVSGTIDAFMQQLNAYLKLVGCKHTHFLNPHGLHHPQHRTTAYDMALLARQALKNAHFCQMVATTSHVRPKTNKQNASQLVQTNKLLKKGPFYYPYAIGVKTGYTSLAQRTLVAAATKDGRTLIAVLLKCKERATIYKDAIKLFEAAFNQPKIERVLLQAGKKDYMLHLDGAKKPIPTYLPQEIAVQYYPAEEPKFSAEVQWRPVSLPVLPDQPVGDICIYVHTADGQNQLCQVPLLAAEHVAATWLHWLTSKW